MPLSTKAVENVKSTIDGFVKDGSPGLVFHAIDRSGKTLVEHASGTLGVDSSEPMNTQSTVFWIASCTKLVTAIAVLQLVEQGKIPLDDAEFIKKTAPELSEKKVYADGINGVEQENSITMRMLLSHTAGFGYSFIDPRIQADRPEGGSGDKRDILDAKLLNQPGSMWEYGVRLTYITISNPYIDHTVDQHGMGRHRSRACYRANARRLLSRPCLHASRHRCRRRIYVPIEGSSKEPGAHAST
jgi:hypothetical protein